MKRINIVLRTDFKELRRTSGFWIGGITFISIAIMVGGIISYFLNRVVWLKLETGRPMLKLIIGIIVYSITLFAPITTIWGFASIPIAKEKVNGNIDSLLSTPLSPKTIWMAKSLSIYLPGWIMSMLSTSIAVLILNGFVITPTTSRFILPTPVLFIGLLTNPLFTFGLTALTILLAFAYHPDTALAPAFLIGFGLMIGIPVGLALRVIDLTSWTFVYYNLAAAIAIWIIICFLSSLLTKERITLSSKGE